MNSAAPCMAARPGSSSDCVPCWRRSSTTSSVVLSAASATSAMSLNACVHSDPRCICWPTFGNQAGHAEQIGPPTIPSQCNVPGVICLCRGQHLPQVFVQWRTMMSACTELGGPLAGLSLSVADAAEGADTSLFTADAAGAAGTAADDAISWSSAGADVAGGGGRKPCAVSSSRMRPADTNGCLNMMSRVTCVHETPAISPGTGSPNTPALANPARPHSI